MKKLLSKRIWRWLVLLAVIAIIIVWRRGSGGLIVEVASIDQADITKTTLSSGAVILPDSLSVRAPITGQVGTLSVNEGDAVKRGQVLFIYREDFLLSALRQAESAYAQAKLARDQVSRSAPTVLQINAAQVALDVASAARDRAKTAYDAAPSDITLATYQQADAAYQQARASLESVQRQNPTSLTTESADAAVNAAAAGLRQAQADWANRAVIAPADGTVSFTTSQVGQKIAPSVTLTSGQTVMSVAGSSDLRFQADMDESDVVRLKIGQPVTVTLDAFSGESFPAVISELPVQPVTNVTGGTIFQVGIKLTTPPASLRVGLRGQASVELESVKNVLAVPTAALVTKEGKTFVWLVKDGQAQRRDVKLGLESATNAQVVSGLEKGDQVVTSTNIRDIKEGLAVTISQ